MAKKKATKGLVTDLVLFNDMFEGGQVPIGKIFEYYAFESTGKTTFCLEQARAYENPYYICFENELNEEYVKRIGVKLAALKKPLTFEAGIDDFFDKFKGSVMGELKFDALFIDTLSAAVCQEELDASMSDNNYGYLAKKAKLFCKKAEAILKPLGVSVIIVSHKMDNIGASPFGGDKFVTPGGRYKSYAATYRINMTRKAAKVFKDRGAHIISLYCKKDKWNNEMRRSSCEYLITRGQGIHYGYEAFGLGIECGAIVRSGQEYTYGELKLRGKELMMDHLNDNLKDRKAVIKAWHEYNKD